MEKKMKGKKGGEGTAFLVTLVARGRCRAFGEVKGGKIELCLLGKIAQSCWQEIPGHFFMASLDRFVVMPNHVHGILVLKPAPGVSGKIPVRRRLDFILAAYKSVVTTLSQVEGLARVVWEDADQVRKINKGQIGLARRYVEENPMNWEMDPLSLPLDRRDYGAKGLPEPPAVHESGEPGWGPLGLAA